MAHTCTRIAIVLVIAGALAAPAAALPTGETTGAFREVQGVESVVLATRGTLVLSQGSAESLEIVATAADLAKITTVVTAGTLQIGTVRSDDPPRGQVTYRLTVKKVLGLTTNSSGTIRADRLVTDALRVAIHSSGSVQIASLAVRSLEVEITSSGNVSVGGSADRQAVRLSSSGAYRAADLASREASILLTSSGSATVRASDLLEGRVSSSGSLRYLGNPRDVTVRATSSGRLVKLD